MHYLSDYQTFDSVQELNYHVKQHTNVHKYEMNDTQRNILQFIAQYSVKFAGASHLKMETIANGIGKSRRTIERAIRVLIELGIIEKISTTRRITGGKGANIYRILPFNDVSEMSHCSNRENVSERKVVRPKTKKETDNLLSDYTYILDTAQATKNAIPAPIYSALSPFFNGADIRRLTGIILRAKRKDQRVESYPDELNTLILDVIRRFKGGQISNIDGYLYTSVKRLFKRLYWAELHAEVYGI
ncbi:helix-turn-helix domain-containing protein [Ornithinibacillus sp. FSL M8-0202]|uniref:helix-turn-helix domain-containing protein n=1 Tax=Ornithinibacillus sp. FSL M8-0202 TaxID=2921616 RepID=UPI0030CC2377